MTSDQTSAIVNSHEIITGEFTKNTEFSLPSDRLKLSLEARLADNLSMFDASELARALMGDSIFSNMILLGAAWQNGLVPLSHAALAKAIELNGAAPDRNLRAFEIGRWAVLFPEQIDRFVTSSVVSLPKTLDEKIAFREAHLTAYQGKRLARKYRKALDQVADPLLREAVAEGYHKVLSYKDEYEVARLHLSTLEKAQETFEGDLELSYHLAPPLLSKTGPDGRPAKKAYGSGMIRWFRLLAKMKSLRGTPLDIFGYSAERKMERDLIKQYANDIKLMINASNADAAIALARLPLDIRGFGVVKEQNAKKAALRREELLAALNSTQSVKTAAE